MDLGRYEQPEILTKEEIDNIVNSGDEDKICRAIISAGLYIDDFDYVLNLSIKLANHPDEYVRGNVITALEYIAQPGNPMPIHPTADIMASGLDDESEYVRGQANGAYDNFEWLFPDITAEIERIRGKKYEG
jgi:hypothetical protein